jgi:REP element-mobilizing transposase RayT
MNKNNFTIPEIKFEKDHIHFNYPLAQSVTNVLAKLKQYLAFHIWQDLLYKTVYEAIFGKIRTFWSCGYFASSIIQVSSDFSEIHSKPRFSIMRDVFIR